MANPNFHLLTDAAKLVEPLLGELVFVGGCATALHSASRSWWIAIRTGLVRKRREDAINYVPNSSTYGASSLAFRSS
jgi:hypothetical protein